MSYTIFMKTIPIACVGFDTAPLDHFNELQGDLKSLSDSAYKQLRTEILERGFSFPFNVWVTPEKVMYLCDGHQRARTLKRMRAEEGYEIPSLPYSLTQADSYEEAKAKCLAAASQYGKFESEGLMNFLKDTAMKPDDLIARFRFPEVNLKDFKKEFEKREIQVSAHSRTLGNPDDVPELPAGGSVRTGDLWLLGEHRILCGDSTNPEMVSHLMADEKAGLLFTDPPYNIDFEPQRGTHEKILNDSMSANDFSKWLSSALLCASIATVEDSFAFVWSGWSTVDQFAPVLRSFYEVKAMPIWVKNNFGIGYYSRPKYEPFFLCLKGKPATPIQAPADVWEHPKVHETQHSCEKPVGLIEQILEAYDHRRSSVLDLFGGSGSTLIACEKTGRKSFTMELDPRYVALMLSRWSLFTGQDPVRSDGVKWSELK